jgi:hypothetical protein
MRLLVRWAELRKSEPKPTQKLKQQLKKARKTWKAQVAAKLTPKTLT